MSTETIYSIRLRYLMDNQAGAATRALTNDTKALTREVSTAKGMFKSLGATVVGYFSAREAGKALIGFNETVEDTKVQIAGMLAMAKHTGFTDEISRADRIYADLQKRAAKLPGTTQEYVTMAGMLTQPITDAGLGMKDLEDLTVSAVVGAKALRVEAGAAARDMDQALRGQFHSNDVFTGKILGSAGFKGEEGRAKFNAMSPEERAETLRAALTTKQLTELAAAQGATFSGTLSTLVDTLQQFFGKVGLPLFQAITVEIRSWNAWIDDNSVKVDHFAKALGEGLVTGFRYVKDALSFLVDHADLLLTIGKVWAATKFAGMLGNFAGGGPGGGGLMGIADKGSKLAGWMRGARDEFDPETGQYKYTPAGAGRQKLTGSSVLGNLGMIGQAGAAGYAFGNLIGLDEVGSRLGDSLAHLTGRTDATTDEFMRIERASQHLTASLELAASKGGPKTLANMEGMRADMNQQYQVLQDLQRAYTTHNPALGARALNAAKDMGLDPDSYRDLGQIKAEMKYLDAQIHQMGGRQGVVGIETLASIEASQLVMTEYQRRTLDVEKAQQDVSTYLAQHLAAGDAKMADILKIILGDTDDPTGKRKPVSSKPSVNVTVQRIEVQSDDPDRFVFGMVEAFRDYNKNPSQAIAAIREG